MAIVRYSINNLPRVTKEEIEAMRAMAERPDSEIDFSDIPETTQEELAQFRPARLKIKFYKEAEPAETTT